MAWNKSIRIVIAQYPPFTMFRNDISSLLTTADGPGVRLATEIMENLNLKYTVEPQKDGIFGIRNSSGHFSGVMGNVQRDEADVGAILAMTRERDQAVAFSSYCFRANTAIMGGFIPEPTVVSILRLALVFDMQVWVCLFVSMFLLVYVSGLNIRTENSLDNEETTGKFSPRTRVHSLIELPSWKSSGPLLSSFISALFFEGTPRSPGNNRARFLFGLWLLSMLVLANGFCGIMRATMMAPPKIEKVQSEQHLSTLLHKIQPMTIAETFMEEYFKGGQSHETQLIWKALQNKGGLVKMKQVGSEETLAKITEGKAVLIAVEENARFKSGLACDALNITNLYFAREPAFTSYTAMIFSKKLDKAIVKAINKRIPLYRESYILDKWVEDEMADTSRCFSATVETTNERPLGMDEMGGLMYLYLFCLCLSGLVLLVELLLSFTRKTEESQVISTTGNTKYP